MSGQADRLRIGDTDRERAQAALSDHYAAGRLDHDEYSERLDLIWAARTQADLDPVFVDLPGQHGTSRRAPYSTPVGRATAPPARWGPRLPMPLLFVLVALLALTVVTHLPLILIGLGVWILFVKGARRGPGRRW